MNITINEILNKHCIKYGESENLNSAIMLMSEARLAIIEYATELLKYATEKVELTGTWGKDSIIGKGLSTRDSDEEWISLYINENSILNIIKELK